MFTHYAAGEGEKFVWAAEDPSVFCKVENLPFYKKYVYLYPFENENPPMWLWVVGHEKADPTKALYNRVRQSCLIIHFCIGGKGYYNDQPITPGTMFICWPGIKHSLVADPTDPFEFYWLALRGDAMLQTVQKMGFQSTKLISRCNYVIEVAQLLDHYINLDHTKIDL